MFISLSLPSNGSTFHNIKMDVKLGCEVVGAITPFQGKYQWLAVVDATMNLRIL
jgi:hypothetical protein